MISPEPDSYGSYARFSMLADYCELLALHEIRISSSGLADFIRDNEWEIRPLIAPAGMVRADIEALDSEQAAQVVFSTVRSRSEILGPKYPFKFDRNALVLRVRQPGRSTYAAYLSLAAAHSYGIAKEEQPELVFEESVAATISGRNGILATGLGTARRQGGSFETALQRACETIGLVADPTGVARRAYAHDEGVDTIVHISWGDFRPGAFTWIGQATCAKSNDWEMNFSQPAPEAWGRLLGSQTPPCAFLAVPYHVEDDHLDKLIAFRARVVLDRLRLTAYKRAVSEPEARIIEAVRTAQIDAP